MREVDVVGAFVRDERNRVYAQRRSPHRRLLPGTWDIVGGHVEPGETPEDALAREITEETGWTLRRIETVLDEWRWEWGGVVHHEIDYLVEVDGDLGRPHLEEGRHDASAWVGPDDLDLMMLNRPDDDRGLRDLVARVVRLRLTPRLRLEPIGPRHAGDLWRLHHHPAVAAWYHGRWTAGTAERRAATYGRAWEEAGVSRWLAYDRITGEVVGRGGLARTVVDGRGRLDVGWVVRPDLWGRGYATEIGRAGLAFAFDDLGAEEVVAVAEPHNLRSRRVMERLGMRYSRDVRHEGYPFVLYTAGRGGRTP